MIYLSFSGHTLALTSIHYFFVCHICVTIRSTGALFFSESFCMLFKKGRQLILPSCIGLLPPVMNQPIASCASMLWCRSQYQVCVFIEVYFMLSINYTSNRSSHLIWSPDTHTQTSTIEEEDTVQAQHANPLMLIMNTYAFMISSSLTMQVGFTLCSSPPPTFFLGP